MAFCTSLRRRAAFKSLLPALTKDGFREQPIKTHDISFPICTQAHDYQQHELRVLLFSNDDTLAAAVERIRLMSSSTAGSMIILYLMSSSQSQQMTYSALQTVLLDSANSIPLLPVVSDHQIIPTMQKHASSKPGSLPEGKPSETCFDILRQCTLSPPMDETLAYFVTDLFENLVELAVACSTVPDHLLQTTQDGPSHYFSSSLSSDVEVTSAGELEHMNKISLLKSLDDEGTMNMLKYWRTNGVL